VSYLQNIITVFRWLHTALDSTLIPDPPHIYTPCWKNLRSRLAKTLLLSSTIFNSHLSIHYQCSISKRWGEKEGGRNVISDKVGRGGALVHVMHYGIHYAAVIKYAIFLWKCNVFTTHSKIVLLHVHTWSHPTLHSPKGSVPGCQGNGRGSVRHQLQKTMRSHDQKQPYQPAVHIVCINFTFY